jgi:oligopeptide/dipeptide ABC transporter ATP-binding protein
VSDAESPGLPPSIDGEGESTYIGAAPTAAGLVEGVASLDEVPKVSTEPYALPGSEPILEVRDLVKIFPIRTGFFSRATGGVQAVSGVSFTVGRGQTVGVVGESGCGKSTMGRLVLRLIEATSGSVSFDGHDVLHLSRRDLKSFRRRAQIVFQDPYASLNPRMTVRAIIGEPLDIAGRSRKDTAARVKELMSLVGLNPEYGNRFPHEFSGGQRQRIGIARAIATEPEFLVLDEPVSALDVSIQAGVVNLLEDLQDTLGLSYVFIAHDLSVVRHISDMVAVMYLGKIIEIGPATEVYERASHPYTQALLSAVPVPDPRKERERTRIVLQGDVPSPANPPSGCRFRTRCWKAEEICAREEPALIDRGDGHPVACHFSEVAVVI